MYSFSHSYMHVTLFEIQKASRQCSIQTSLAVSPLSSDEMASSNPAKDTGLTIRGRCTYNKNTEWFFFKKKVKLWRHHQLLLICFSFSLFGCSRSVGDLIRRSGSGPTNLTTSKTIWRALHLPHLPACSLKCRVTWGIRPRTIKDSFDHSALFSERSKWLLPRNYSSSYKSSPGLSHWSITVDKTGGIALKSLALAQFAKIKQCVGRGCTDKCKICTETHVGRCYMSRFQWAKSQTPSPAWWAGMTGEMPLLRASAPL